MVKKRIEGVSGVLGGLITPDTAAEVDESRRNATRLEEAQENELPTASPPRLYARRGRPPNRKGSPPPRREKVTLRVDAALIARYREWSWEERRQLGELVEAALRRFIHKRYSGRNDTSD